MGNALRIFKRILGRLQTSWSIMGITLVVLLLVEGGFRVIFAVRDRLTAVVVPDRRVVQGGYGGADWPVIHYRELEQLQERWHPYVYFRQKPFRGQTITIGDDGRRATWQSPALPGARGGHQSLKILMLGGSSFWGFGARDDQTIPSLLARSLHEKGWSVEVKNLAEIGYVSTQELIALTRELQAGYRPDLVIFYDGVNDSTSALLEGEAGLTTNEINRRGEFNLLQSPSRLAATLSVKLVRDSGSYRFAQMVRRRLGGMTAQATPRVPKLADDVVRYYEANVTLAQSLGKSFGFLPLFFWQPTVFTKPALVPVEGDEAQKYAWAKPFIDDVYGKIGASPRLKADSAFHDLSTIFAGNEGLVFIDYCHTTEEANARIAAEIATTVVKAMSSRPADGRNRAGLDRGHEPKDIQ
jgi:lysophospholipase L1-like esterase